MRACWLLIALPSAVSAAPPEKLFETADRCMACHNNLVTPGGRDVAIGTMWRASMMANAARDPYWQGTIRAETMDHPAARAAIEDECSKCHMPMARFLAHAKGRSGEIFAHLPVGTVTAMESRLAVDGVSCTACHQIQKEGLGSKESFTGGFVVDVTRPLDERQIFGPFAVDAGRTTIMRSASGFRPTPAPHIQQAELCATCHTLYTHALGAKGEVVGEFPEQVPYLEWQHSRYPASHSCQSCHMPVVGEATPASSVWGEARTEFSQHAFRGGNFFIPQILNRHRADLGVAAQSSELERTARDTIEHLQSSSASISVDGSCGRSGELELLVSIQHAAGHKLPTAYPSRRAWLHVVVRDAKQQVVFESGRLAANGAIRGNDNDVDPSLYERHYEEIRQADEVQIYEAILADAHGRVTTGLLEAITFLKDNRLLPDGFDKATAHQDIAVHGRAAEDTTFVGGGDQVRYVIDVGEAKGPFNIEVKLWYQPIGFRWAHNLERHASMETDRFVSHFESMAAASAAPLGGQDLTLE